MGLHVLEGSISKLKVPYLVTSKDSNSSNSNNNNNNSNMSSSSSGSGIYDNSNSIYNSSNSSSSNEGSLRVEGVVRHRILFNSRPKPKPL